MSKTDMGRPKKFTADLRSEQIHLNVTACEKADIYAGNFARAELEGKRPNRSDWLRDVLLAAAAKDVAELEKARKRADKRDTETANLRG